MYRPSLDDISPLTMPCVLLLKDNASCVLTALSDESAGVILPEMGDGVQSVPREELEKQYSGYAVFGALESRVDARTEPVKLGRSRHWFWDVLRFYMPIYRHVALASVVVNTIAVASSLFVMNVYDRVIPNNAYETLWVLAAGVTLAYIFDFLLRSLRSHFVDLAGRNADVVLSSKLIDKVLSMRMDAKPESTGALVNNLREFESLREFFSSTTCLPRRATAIRLSSSVLRSGGTSAISSCAASTRNFGFVPRAFGPRANQASSRRRAFCRFSSAKAAKRSRSTRCWI